MSPQPRSPSARSSQTTASSSMSSLRSPAIVEDLVVALHDFAPATTSVDSCLCFRSGQIIRVLNRDRSGWWDGEMAPGSDDTSSPRSASQLTTRGWFPSNYVTSITPNSKVGPIHPSRPPSLASIASGTSSVDEHPIDSPTASMVSTSPDRNSAFYATHGRPSRSSTSTSNSREQLSELATASVVLNPIMHAINLLQADVHHDRFSKVQPATANIISAVRAVLDSTHCLHRDSPALRHHPSLSRERKQVLSVLACLVDKARKTSIHEQSGHLVTSTADGTDQAELRHQMESILKLADKVLVHVRRFLFVAQRCGIPLPNQSILGPPFMLSHDQRSTFMSPHGSQDPSSRHLRSMRSASTLTSSPSPDGHQVLRPRRSTQSVQMPSHQGHPKTHGRNFSVSSVKTNKSSSANMPPMGLYSNHQMSTLVEKSHDQVLSMVAVFIGHAHIHSRSAHPSSHSHLIDMTRDVIEKVREMLVLVEALSKNFGSRRQQSSAMLVEVREALYQSTTSLVTAARVATSTPIADSPLASSADDDLDALLVSATAVLRATNDCMSVVAKCLAGLDPAGGEYAIPLTGALFTMSSITPPVPAEIRAGSVERPESDSPQTDASRRSCHTLSMLGRKANSLNASHSQFESSETYSAGSSPVLSQDIPLFPAVEPGLAPPHDAHAPDGRLSRTKYGHRSTTLSGNHSNGRRGTVGELVGNQELHSTGPRSSGRSLSGGTEPSCASGSFSGLSDRRHSRDSSPPTSANTSHAEDDLSQHVPRLTRASNLHCSPDQLLHTDAHHARLPSRDYIQEELAFNADGQVIGGSLRGLVARMTLHDTPVEATFSHAFFMTFRMFATPIELANALIARFDSTCVPQDDHQEVQGTHSTKATPIRLRVYNVMKSWLETHWRMDSDAVVLPVISRWAESRMATLLPTPAERLVDLVQRRLRESQMDPQHSAIDPRSKGKPTLGSMGSPTFGKLPIPPSIVSKNLIGQLRNGGAMAVHLLDFDPTELARQITLMESKLYRAIRPDEIIGQDFSKRPSSASNVRAMSGMSTKITGWITESILNEEDIKGRTQILKFWIKIGNKLLELQNYNALMSVMSALNSSTIIRLKRTWEALGSKTRTVFDGLNRAVSHHRNYAEYRATLRKAHTPCIPFLGVYLTDMTFCHEGNPTHRVSPHDPGVKLINFDRYQKMAKIINELERFQVPFSLSEVPEIIAYIQASMDTLAHEGSADSLYRRSLMIEPRDAANGGGGSGSVVGGNQHQNGHVGSSHPPLFNWKAA